MLEVRLQFFQPPNHRLPAQSLPAASLPSVQVYQDCRTCLQACWPRESPRLEEAPASSKPTKPCKLAKTAGFEDCNLQIGPTAGATATLAPPGKQIPASQEITAAKGQAAKGLPGLQDSRIATLPGLQDRGLQASNRAHSCSHNHVSITWQANPCCKSRLTMDVLLQPPSPR